MPDMSVPMRLPSTTLPVPPRYRPSDELPEIRLPAPEAVPPIVLPAEPTPMPISLPRATVPVTSVPMKLPSTTLSVASRTTATSELPEIRLPCAGGRAADRVVGRTDVDAVSVAQGHGAGDIGADKVAQYDVIRGPAIE